MLIVGEVEVGELSVAPQGSALDVRVVRGEVGEDVSLEHRLDTLCKIRIAFNDVVNGAHSEE